MSEITKSGIVLTYGPNDKREPGRVHYEFHAPCGCAFHERPAPHWHQCPLHATPEMHADGLPIPNEITDAVVKVRRFCKANRLHIDLNTGNVLTSAEIAKFVKFSPSYHKA